MTKKKAPFLRPAWRTVDGRAATLLTTFRSARPLAPFFAGPRGMTDAAGQLGVTTQALRYWVRQYLAADLLCEVPGSGQAARAYVTSAETFVVRLSDWSARTFDELLLARERALGGAFDVALRAALLDAFPDKWGVRLSAGRDAGQLSVQVCGSGGAALPLETLVRDPAAPALLSCWLPLDLDFEEAKLFQRELAALMLRYAGRRGGQRYLAHLALTPLTRA